MHRFLFTLFCGVVFAAAVSGGVAHTDEPGAMQVARARAGDLRLDVYVTVGSVVKLAEDPAARVEAAARLSELGITKVCLEVYRGGTRATVGQLRTTRDFFRENRFDVVGGIATVAGESVGVASNEGLQWFNYEAPETRQALETIIRETAPLFEYFIIDDFLCTGDTSEISRQAMAGRDWGEYRRDLLARVARDAIVGPAKQANPNIRMLIKYPQWYDLFHVFGYDVARGPKIYDQVWVGTETRGANTQRYGYVQPYEGFINYRWIAQIAGAKIGGAWFDHGDCDEFDFIDQAWQSVAAGAPELVLFCFGDIMKGHPGHDRLRREFSTLADLAAWVRDHPVTGPVGYKPANSDAGEERYVMDYIGMLGISLVPAATFPADADTLFLPTQSAAAPAIIEKVEAAIGAGKNLIMTPGFLAKAATAEHVARWTGLRGPVNLRPLRAGTVMVDGHAQPIEYGLDLAAELEPDGAEVRLEAVVEQRGIPFLTAHAAGAGRVFVLNVRTFSQSDFDAANEVLLAPRPLGLTRLPRPWADTVRAAFTVGADWRLSAPARVTCQQLGQSGWLIQNYHAEPVDVALTLDSPPGKYLEALTGMPLEPLQNTFNLRLQPRGRVWMKKVGG